MSAFDDETFVNRSLDLVIPPEGEHPGAGSLGLLPKLRAMLEPTPEMVPLLAAGFDALQALADPPTVEALQQVDREQPAFLPTLQLYLYIAYYQRPEVLRSLGESGRPPFPEGRPIDATDESLLKKLKSRANA